MVAEMVVGVVDQDAEDDAAEEFAAVGVGVSALGLEEVDKFEIACPGLAIGSLGEGHGGDEGQTPSFRGAVESFGDECGVGAAGHADGAGRGQANAGFAGQAVGDQFPGADVVAVLFAGELGDAQLALFVSNGGLWACAAERGSRREELREPLIGIAVTAGGIARFEAEAGGLEFGQRRDGWCGQCVFGIEPAAGCGVLEAESAESGLVVNTEEEVPIGERARGAPFAFCPQVFAPLHEEASPPIRGGVEEDAEVGAMRGWILGAWEVGEVGIEAEGVR